VPPDTCYLISPAFLVLQGAMSVAMHQLQPALLAFQDFTSRMVIVDYASVIVVFALMHPSASLAWLDFTLKVMLAIPAFYPTVVHAIVLYYALIAFKITSF
jgi:hypothetical protein